MKTILSALLVLTLIAVTVVLFMGIGSMSRGGEFNRKYGNLLMRWRIGLQALAVIIIIAIVYVSQT